MHKFEDTRHNSMQYHVTIVTWLKCLYLLMFLCIKGEGEDTGRSDKYIALYSLHRIHQSLVRFSEDVFAQHVEAALIPAEFLETIRTVLDEAIKD